MLLGFAVYLRVMSKLATVILAVTIVLYAMAAFTPHVCESCFGRQWRTGCSRSKGDTDQG